MLPSNVHCDTSDDTDKIFTVFYVFVGLGVLFGTFAECLEAMFDKLEQKARDKLREARQFEMSVDNRHSTPPNDDDIILKTRRKILFLITQIILVILIGGAIVSSLEGWSYVQGVYWAYQVIFCFPMHTSHL